MKETPETDKQQLPPGLIDVAVFMDAMGHFVGEPSPDGGYEAPLQQAVRDGYLSPPVALLIDEDVRSAATQLQMLYDGGATQKYVKRDIPSADRESG